MPSEARLAEMLRQLSGARADARVRIEHDGALVVRYRGAAAVVERGAAHAGVVPVAGRRRACAWARAGRVRFEPRPARASTRAARRRGWHFGRARGASASALDAAAPARTLKNLLQEARHPALGARALPLLYCGDELVWVPGIGIAAGYAARRAARAGVMPDVAAETGLSPVLLRDSGALVLESNS